MKPLLRARLRILVIGEAIFLIVSVTAPVLFFSSCALDPCGNEVIAEVPSPDGKLKVVVFTRDCGATTDFTTQASILGTNEKVENEAGNVFDADSNRGAAPTVPGRGPSLFVSWQSADSVVLSFHSKARVYRKEFNVRGVRVSYSYSDNAAQPGGAANRSQPVTAQTNGTSSAAGSGR